jgi:hypothetical protein
MCERLACKRRGPVRIKTRAKVIALEIAIMLQFATAAEIRLQIWFSGGDRYTAQNVTGMWGI